MSSTDSEAANERVRADAVKVHRVPTPAEAVTHILARWWLVLLVTAAGTALGVLASFRFNPVYQSFALLRLRSPSEASIGTSSGDTSTTAPPVDPGEVIRRLKIALGAPATLEPIVKDLERHFSPKELRNREALINWLGGINVDRKSGDLYSIMARGHSAEVAQKVAERLADRALALYRADAEEQVVRLEAFARGQVQAESEKIKKLEAEMVDFLEKHPVMKVRSLDSDPAAQDGDRLRSRDRRSPVGISLDRSAEKDPKLKELLAKQQRLRTELRSLTESTTSGTTALTDALREAKNQLGVLRGQGLKDAHPQVKQVLARIKELEGKLAKAAPGSKTANSEYEARVRAELQQVQQAIRKRVAALAPASAPQVKEDVTALEAEWARLRRQHTLLTDSHAKLEEVAVNASLKKNLGLYEARKMATIVGKPRLADGPTGLTRPTIVATLAVVSLLGALGLAVLLGLLDTRLMQPEHLARASKSLTLLAVLADHPLRAVDAAARVRPHGLSAGGDRSEAPKLLPPPSGRGDSVIQWLRGTDDLDQAISLLKADTPEQGSAAAGPGGGAADSGILDAAQTLFFDRNAPQPLGAPGAALMIAPAGHGAMVQGANGRPSGPSVPPPKICVLPSTPPYAPGLFVSVDPASKPAEQMRLLAGRLEARVGTSLRVVAVSSWEEGVGKTTVAANLIMVLAESQKRVLAVDACPGKASLTRIFGIEPDGIGLCDQLQRWLDARKGPTAPWELVQIAETLTICTSSSVARPALPLLASEAFTRFIGDMSHFYDAIVIDTEALQAASDAVVLQRLVDGYVMVVARGRSTARGLQDISSRLDPARVLGYVFNEHR